MGAEVAVIIVNWNGWRDTTECIHSLKNLDYDNFRIIVVDNCSSDDSVQEISRQHPDVTLIQAPRNLGFAGGNNLGILHALEANPKYLWLLNNDTVVVPHALRALIELADSHPGYHFYGSWIARIRAPTEFGSAAECTGRSPDTSAPPTTAIGSPIVPRRGRPTRPIGLPDARCWCPRRRSARSA